ncbi:hypothetical protein HU200_047324 [Digitaria exilis]|uniref:Uncharacterized protein n=1 Tax=Digitaria exilis TaxID=1010633 RepID=A0A835EBN2_9POAL|nr:hypothetical protein HU200_047324 [Digitaria exilis]
MSSDKPVSASLQPNNQLTLHSEQVPAHSSLATSLQPNNQLMLLSEEMPVESSLPSSVTDHWNFAPDVFISCLENNEICMQAACALLRQRKLTIQGGRSGCTKFSKSDALRLSEAEDAEGAEAELLVFHPAVCLAGFQHGPGTSVDQGIAYVLMLVALVLTYLIHPLDASSAYKLF